MTAAADPTVRSDASASPLGIAPKATVFSATVLLIVALAVLPLLTPWFVHVALDVAGAAERLGVTPDVAYALSDRSVDALLLGGSFDITGPDGLPFYDIDEMGHLGDARLLLWLLLGAGTASLVALAIMFARHREAERAALWRVVSGAGLASVVVVIALGLVSLVAFSSLFTLFHQVFFPAGNWTFDAATQRLVQLYPYRFWQVAAAALGVLVVAFAAGAWLLGRTMAARGPRRPS